MYLRKTARFAASMESRHVQNDAHSTSTAIRWHNPCSSHRVVGFIDQTKRTVSARAVIIVQISWPKTGLGSQTFVPWRNNAIGKLISNAQAEPLPWEIGKAQRTEMDISVIQ